MPKDKKPKKPKAAKKPKLNPTGTQATDGLGNAFRWETTTAGDGLDYHGHMTLDLKPPARNRRLHVTLHLSPFQWQLWPLHRWLWRNADSFCLNTYLGPLRLEVRKS